MPVFSLSPGNTLSYELVIPRDGRRTFVFFNALSGDKNLWMDSVVGPLIGAGHGILIYNLRGQAGSDTTSTDITVASIIEDAKALLAHVRPERPIHVGLSIGGLFSLGCHLAGGDGQRADGIVLLNTLRKQTPRLEWINDAIARAAELGGFELMKDLYFPLLMNVDWQAANRHHFLKSETYVPLPKDDIALQLMRSGATADWNVDYERIVIPVLAVSGLQDRVFYDAGDVSELAARMPQCRRLDMPQAGHMIPLEQPEILARELLAFADALD